MSSTEPVSRKVKAIGTAIGLTIVIGGLYFSGLYLIFLPGMWVDAGNGAPYDLIFSGTISQVYQSNCHGVYGFSFQDCWNYNVTFGHSLVMAANSKWNPTTETVAFSSVLVVTGCGSHTANQSVIVMVTVKDKQLVLPNNSQAVQAVDPPQFMTPSYKAESC